jgi:hypothetical protein
VVNERFVAGSRLQVRSRGGRRLIMGVAKTRSSGLWSLARWIVLVAIAVIATACAQIPGDAGSVSTTSIPTTSTDVATTMMVETSTTSTIPSTTSTIAQESTTSTVAEQAMEAPPKPEGEPDIELLPIRPPMITVEVDSETGQSDIEGALAPYFSFERLSGFDSYTVNLIRSTRGGDAAGTFSTEGRVEAGSMYFTGGGDGFDSYEVVIDERDKLWIRENGVWNLGTEGSEGYLFQVLVLPDWQHSLLFEAFETLTFSDWDLIDGVWYARYAASPEFAAAMTGRWLLSEDGTTVAGDVWIAPQGYMHSYSVSVERGDSGQVEETTWTLSDLGSTSFDVPAPGGVPPSTTTTEAPSSLSMLEDLLTTEFWDPTVLLDAQPFRWRARSFLYLVDLDPSDVARYEGEQRTYEYWGRVGAGGIEREHTYGFDIDTRDGGEFIQFDGTSSRRFGSFSIEGTFEPDDDGWWSFEREARPSHVAAGLFDTAYRMYNNYEKPVLDVVGVEEVGGVRVTRLRAVVSDGGDGVFRFNAIFDFWIDEGSREPRVLRMTYTADWERDLFTDGIVTGREIAEKSFEVYDIGDETIVIESP